MTARLEMGRAKSGENESGLARFRVGRFGGLLLGGLAAAVGSLALLQGWQHRYDVSSDGLSYLEMADAFVRRDWAAAANGTWSPLYPFLVGLVQALAHPGFRREAPAVHLLNLGIFALAAAAFAFFVRELVRFDSSEGPADDASAFRVLPTSALVLVALVVFAEGVLGFIGIAFVSPDLCVAAAFFFATGLIVRMQRGVASLGSYLALGAVLGLGYLAKAVFLPLAVVFLVAAAGAGTRARRARGTALALVAFVLLASPWIAFLSLSRGRFTFGEAGRLNYAWYVSGVSAPPHFWQGGPDGAGTPIHPARVLEKDPDVYALDRPIPVSYPAWYDPSYWYEGVRARFNPGGQARVIARSARWYGHALLGVPGQDAPAMQATVVWGLALLIYVGGQGRGVWRNLRRHAWILLPTVGGLGLYALVHLEARYVGAMIAVLFVVSFALVRLPADEAMRRFVAGVVGAMLIVWVSGWLYAFSGAWSERAGVEGFSEPFEVAEGLRHMGLRPGTPVAFAGISPRFYWARLAGVRVIAELRGGSFVPGNSEPDELARYWLGDESSRRQILGAFQRAGADLAVTDARPPGGGDEWIRLGRSRFFARRLDVPVR